MMCRRAAETTQRGFACPWIGTPGESSQKLGRFRIVDESQRVDGFTAVARISGVDQFGKMTYRSGVTQPAQHTDDDTADLGVRVFEFGDQSADRSCPLGDQSRSCPIASVLVRQESNQFVY